MKKLSFILAIFLFPCIVKAQNPLAVNGYPGLNTVAAQTGINLTNSPINLHKLNFRPVGAVSTCTVALDSSADGVTWSAGGAITGTSCTSAGNATSASPFETNFVRVNLTAFSGSGSVNIVYSGTSLLTGTFASDPNGNIKIISSTAGQPAATVEGNSATPTVMGASNGSTNPLAVETFGVDPCQSAGVTKKSVPITITSATTTSLVATNGTTVIYPCSVSVTIAPSATTADTFLLEFGTGAACVTTQSVQTGTFGNGTVPAANTADVVPVTIGEIGPSAAGAAFCAVTTGTTVNVQGITTYVQQ